MRLAAIIFDLDGTLLDTLADLRAALNHALNAKGLPLRTIDQVRHDVGNGVRVLIERSVEGASPELIDELFDIFRPYYAQHASDHTAPYEGILPMLEEVKKQGIRSAIVSNKPDAQVRFLHQRFFAQLIDTAIGEQQPLVRRKPAPDMVNMALRRLGVDRSQAVYVGDSEVDVQTACAARIPCIACTWGFRGRRLLEQAGADILIDSPAQLINRLPDVAPRPS